MITCYAEDFKPKSLRVMRAFADGCAGRVASTGLRELMPGGAAFYGVRAPWLHLFNQARLEKRRWYWLDNSWFDASREVYFRVGVNAAQSWSERESDGARLARCGIKVQPWRITGRHIVICSQSDEFMRVCARWAGGVAGWRSKVVESTEATTERPLRFRAKGYKGPLADDLRDAWLLVAHSSAAAIEALIAGVPVIVTDPQCAASGFASSFDGIESPRMIDGREAFMARLADSQWTEAEMRNGTAWRMLNETAR